MSANADYGMQQRLAACAAEVAKPEIIAEGRKIAKEKIKELLDPKQHVHSVNTPGYEDFKRGFKALKKAEVDELDEKIERLYRQVYFDHSLSLADREKYMTCVMSLEKILCDPDNLRADTYFRKGALPDKEKIESDPRYSSFLNSLNALSQVLETFKVSVFVSYESTAKPFQELLVSHLRRLGVRVNQEVTLTTDTNKHFKQVYEKDFVIVLGTTKYCKNNPEATLVQNRWQKQPHRILRILLEGEHETAFPLFLNTLHVPYCNMTIEENYFSSFFQLVQVLYAPLIEKEPAIREHIYRDTRNDASQALSLKPPHPHSIISFQLREKYKQCWTLNNFFKEGQCPIESSFVHLTHVLETSKDDNFSRQHVDIKHLFSPTQLKTTHQRILIEGQAGTGKSTFCQYIAFHWATLNKRERTKHLGEWSNQHDLPLWIPMRKLIHNTVSFEQFIAETCFPQGIDFQSLTEMLKDPRCSILYLLDGYDEVAALPPHCPAKRICTQLIEQPNWIMTSRPNFYTKWIDRNILHLANVGFSSEGIVRYSEQFFSDCNRPEKLAEFQTLINNNPSVCAMVRTPIHLELLLTHVLKGKITSSITPKELYTLIINELFERDTKRTNTAYNGKEHPAQPYLEILAWEAMEKKIFDIPPEFYRSHIQTDQFNLVFRDLGFLTSNNSTQAPDRATYHFIHHTFQEYFAACHLVKCIKDKKTRSDILNKLSCYKFDRHYENVIIFTAGLLASESKLLKKFFNSILTSPKSCFQLRELYLVLRCLENLPIEKARDFHDIYEKFATLIRDFKSCSRSDRKLIFLIFRNCPRVFSDCQVKKEILDMICPNRRITISCKAMSKKDFSTIQREILTMLCYIDLTDNAFSLELVQLLHQSERVTEWQASVLSCVIPTSAEVIQALCLFVTDKMKKNEGVIYGPAETALARTPPNNTAATNQLLNLLDSTDSDEKIVALTAFGSIQPDKPEVVDKLYKLLFNQNIHVVKMAIQALGNIKPNREDVIKKLAERLCGRDSSVIIATALALGQIRTKNPTAVQKLERLLDSPTMADDVKNAAAEALLAILPNHFKARTHLEKHLSADNKFTKLETAEKLIQLYPNHLKSLQILIELLDDRDTFYSERAAQALQLVDSSDAQVVDELRLCLLRKAETFDALSSQLRTIQALSIIRPPIRDLQQILTSYLQYEKWEFVSKASSALHDLGLVDESVIEILLKHLESPYTELKQYAIEALKQMHPQDPRVSQKLVKLLTDAGVKRYAIQALSQFAVHDYAITQKLAPFLDDSDSSVRCAAATAMSQRDPENIGAKQILLHRLDNATTRYDAIGLAKEIKPKDSGVIDKLIDLLKDAVVAKAVVEALKAIGIQNHNCIFNLNRLRQQGKAGSQVAEEVLLAIPLSTIVRGFQEAQRSQKEVWREILPFHVKKNAGLLFRHNKKQYCEVNGELIALS